MKKRFTGHLRFLLALAGKLVAALLFLCLVMGSCAGESAGESASQPLFPLQPLCFEGEADHWYFDDHLAVSIQKRVTRKLVYFVCDVQTTEPGALRTALSHDRAYGNLEQVSVMAARHGAILAFNGDDYGHSESVNFGVIIRDGAIIRARDTSRHMLVLEPNGDLRVIADRGRQNAAAIASALIEAGVRQTWEFGPELIREGEAVSLNTKFNLISVRNDRLEPRTAIGQVGPLHYVVIVVDGRRKGYSDGISLPGLQKLMLEAGAQTAFNLDGGGSTTLVFRGKVLNRPSGGKERPVSDILYFQ